MRRREQRTGGRGSLPILGLIALTLFIYLPVISFDFLSYDDRGYVTQNAQVLNGLTKEGILWSFRDVSVGHWHPLTWVSHMADAQIYGLNPAGHHLTGLVLHLVNTGLLFALLRWMTGALWQSVVVAFLFALHPLNVESVAWVAERKNVLSTFFWLATMAAYGFYAARPGLWRYTLVFALFVLGLMAKPMLVTLPFLLLLLDYWPLERWPGRPPPPTRESPPDGEIPSPFRRASLARLILEKIPLLIPVFFSVLLTLWAAKTGGAMEGTEELPLVTRLSNMVLSYGSYMVKLIWPADLAVFYPYREAIRPEAVAAWAALLTGISLAALRFARLYPFLAVGWFWYLGSLVPVIGLVQVGAQAMADRYVYVPAVGLFMVLAWGVVSAAERMPGTRTVLIAALLAGFSALSAAAGLQLRYWKDSETLFRHAVSVTTGNYIAHYHLGLALLEGGRRQEAMAQFNKAAAVQPTYEPAYNYMGVVLQLEGKYDDAQSLYRHALAIKPDYGDAWYNLGTLFFATGSLDEAIACYRQAAAVKPLSAPVHNNLGAALVGKGEEAAAVAAFRKALAINPGYVGAHDNLARVLTRMGLLEEAEVHAQEASRLSSQRTLP